MSWLLPLLGAAAVTLAALTLSLGHVRAVRGSPSAEAPRLLAELRRTPADQRIEVAARTSAASSWEGRLARALSASDDPAERADVASEAVGDLALLYGSRSRWAPAAVRIQILGAVLMAAWAIAVSEGLAALVIAGMAFAGALAVHALGRRAQEHERDQRERADSLVTLLMPADPQQPRPVPGGARAAGGRRRR